jgi:hypothetical protein
MPPRERPRHLRAWAVAGAVLVIAATIVGAIAGTGSGDNDKSSFAGISPAAPIDVPSGLRTLRSFADSYTRGDLGAVQKLFASGFSQTMKGRSCNNRRSPLDEPAALAEYQCQWLSLGRPRMRLSGARVDLPARTATAAYALVAHGRQVGSGTIVLHLVPGATGPRVDRVAWTAR